MPGFSAQGGHVILRSQAVQGTFQADLSTAGVGALLRTGALGTTRDILVPDPEIGGGRDVQTAYLGSAVWEGSYDMYPRMKMLATLLKSCFGAASSAVVTGVVTDTITPSDAAGLPYLSIEEGVGAGLETYNYTDGIVNTMHLECDANGYLMGTAGVVAAKQIAGATPTDPSTLNDTTPLVVATNCSVTYNSVVIPVKSFSFDFNNNIESNDFRVGSFYVGGLTPKRRDITASFSIRESSSALWRQATYGVAANTAVGGLPTQQSLVLAMTTYENIAGGTPSTPYSLTLTIPNYMLTPYSLAASGDDVIDSTIEGRGLRPLLATPITTAVIKRGGATAVIA
jgi:hypothetical protein